MSSEFGAHDPEHIYFPSQDSFESGRTSFESLESRVERSFSEFSPNYRGEELFKVDVTLKWTIGDPLGFFKAEFNEDSISVKGKIPVGSSRNLRGSTGFDDWPTVGMSRGVWHGEYSPGKGRLTVGVGIKPPKNEYLTENMLEGNVGLFVGDAVGLKGSIHIMGIGGAGEAAFGWGRGAEMLLDDVSLQILVSLYEMIHQTTLTRVPMY